MTFNFVFKSDVMPTSPNFKINASVKRSHVEVNRDLELIEIINILGDLLLNVKKSIIDAKESYVSSAAVTFLLRRMDVNTQDLLSEELYALMTSFMTVYLSFIQYLLKEDFHEFMGLFSTDDSFLVKENQPFLWYYAIHHKSLLESIQQRFSKPFDSDFILSNIDFIFSKFYTLHFLESFAQKHQKDHGQFYTPQSIIQFMWNKCITLPSFVNHLQNKFLPSVFDPCLGMGSFLCEFLSKCIEACRFTVWNDPHYLSQLLTEIIPDRIWGIEIDPFAYQLSKLNMIVHLFPLYQRLKYLQVNLLPGSIHRLHLFCNDSLKLQIQSNPFHIDTHLIDPFEQHALDLLRQPLKLKFNFIVTNPPYMIRKTGFITQADPIIYDESILGSRGTQAYLYFMWIALQRCDDQYGQVCLITPSQWTVLEFAQHLREWIWKNCKLLDMYEFEPYKVWPKVQTDSLIFRICKRDTVLPNTNYTLYLRHLSRKITLSELLNVYQCFRINQPSFDKDLKYKYTPFISRPLTTKHASFSFILPNASCLEELEALTHHLPRLCDEESTHKMTNAAPLIWNRGPNTNPVYSLVVRTSWAYKTFGPTVCHRYLKPCFYWNGKTISSATGGGKEGDFWKVRDPQRLGKKETSAAEAYWPYCTLDHDQPDVPFYSLILVNKEDTEQLKARYEANEKDIVAFYHYLRDARLALQADKMEVELVHCQYNKCGVGIPVKIIHPINCGYFTRSQPRQRFFVDKNEMAVTNQCIYFTIKPNCPWQDPDFFCGLLNSLMIQFFTKVHCCYDQQGRMRYFGRSMAYIPFASPPSVEFMLFVAACVQGITLARTWLYALIRPLPEAQQPRLMERVRNFEWHLTEDEIHGLDQLQPPPLLLPDTSLSQFQCPAHLQWLDQFVAQHIQTDNPASIFCSLLKISSLFQFAIDQWIYGIYQIPTHLQVELEQELHLEGLRKEWIDELNLKFDSEHLLETYQHIIARAISILHGHTPFNFNPS